MSDTRLVVVAGDLEIRNEARYYSTDTELNASHFRFGTLRQYAMTICAALWLISCSRDSHETELNAFVAEQSAEIGAFPTVTTSFELMGHDPQLRRSYFEELLSSHRKECLSVTKAILKGGFEGTDLWEVTCKSGSWLITFTEDNPPMISSCAQDKQQCSSY